MACFQPKDQKWKFASQETRQQATHQEKLLQDKQWHDAYKTSLKIVQSHSASTSMEFPYWKARRQEAYKSWVSVDLQIEFSLHYNSTFKVIWNFQKNTGNSLRPRGNDWFRQMNILKAFCPNQIWFCTLYHLWWMAFSCLNHIPPRRNPHQCLCPGFG